MDPSQIVDELSRDSFDNLVVLVGVSQGANARHKACNGKIGNHVETVNLLLKSYGKSVNFENARSDINMLNMVPNESEI